MGLVDTGLFEVVEGVFKAMLGEPFTGIFDRLAIGDAEDFNFHGEGEFLGLCGYANNGYGIYNSIHSPHALILLSEH